MDQVLWKAVNEIFHAALELPPRDRPGFVASAAAGDTEIQKEVELLLKADSMAGSFIEAPILANGADLPVAWELQPGQRLCERFRIVRALGQGGMGQVFEAFDEELGVAVALKLIRSEIYSDPEALCRFRREVRLARRITHPNVCRTFDIERDTRPVDGGAGKVQDLIFLTMELLEGETLAAHIHRFGALPLELALEVARQVATALDFAHVLGIVHRDLKPANIMMVPHHGGYLTIRPVITDFGLARFDPKVASEQASALSQTARPIGTLAYMAPEQLKGSPISAATDVYAFGLILFEMATGKPAFASDNFLQGIAQRLIGSPPDPRVFVPSLPKSWCNAIAGCLQPDPAQRFVSAADAVALLDGGRPHFTRLQFLTRPTMLKTVRRLWIPAIILAIVSSLAGAFRLSRLRSDPKVVPGAMLYLAPLRNQTGDRALNNLTELLRAGLSQSVQVNVLDEARVGDILQQMTRPPDSPVDPTTGREIAMRAGAARVVFATASISSGDYKLDVEIQQPDNTPARYRTHWTKTFSWRGPSVAQSGYIAPDLLATVRAATDWIRYETGESANDIARLDTPPEDVTTSSWLALTDYTEAEHLSLRDRAAAVAVLGDAVKADPAFALAYARMGDLLFSLNRTSEGYQAYTHALDERIAFRLTRRERDFIKGTFANDTHDYLSAEQAFRDCSIYYETDSLCLFFRAFPLRMLGRSRDALDVLQRALNISPGFLGVYTSEAYDQILLKNYGRAAQAVASLKRVGRSDQAALITGELDFLNHDFANAEAAFETLKPLRVNEDRSTGYALLARLASEQGRFNDAIRYLAEGIGADQVDGDEHGQSMRLLDRAYIFSRLHKVQLCLRDVRSAINLKSDPEAIISASAILGNLIDRKNNQPNRQIVQELRELKTRIPQDSYGVIFDLARHRVEGEMFLADDKPLKALAEFRAADALDSSISDREYLARALIAASKRQHNPAVALELRREASQAFARMALQPEKIWYYALFFPPGFFRNEIEDEISCLPDKLRDPRRQTLLQALEELSGYPKDLPGKNNAGESLTHND